MGRYCINKDCDEKLDTHEHEVCHHCLIVAHPLRQRIAELEKQLYWAEELMEELIDVDYEYDGNTYVVAQGAHTRKVGE